MPAMSPATSQGWSAYVDTAVGQIHVRRFGEGPPLVLLAPAPRSWTVYRPLLPNLPSLSCHALDTPGFGASDALRGPATMSEYAAAVVAFLDGAGLSSAHVFGLHTGNKIAAALAAEHPDRVGRVVLVGMTHSILVDQERRNAAMRSVVADTADTPITVDADASDAVRDELADVLRARGTDHCYRANYAFDLAGALRAITAPTLVLEHRTEGEAHLGSAAADIVAIMADARAEVLDGSDRRLLRHAPEQIAEPVVAFLGS